MDAQSLFVEHLREALRLLQRYLAIGFTTALALLMLALSRNIGGPISSPKIQEAEKIVIVGLPVPIDPTLARILLIAMFSGVGFLAYAVALDARRLAARIEEHSIREAALSYPTVVSTTDSGLRLLGPLVPAIVYLVFLLIDGLNAPSPNFGTYLFLTLFGAAPYGGVAYEVRNQFGPATGSTDRSSSPVAGGAPPRERSDHSSS